MKKTAIAVLFALSASAAFADTLPPAEHHPLNKIEFALATEAWVTTDTAQVIVGVDANLDQAGMDKIQEQVLASLQEIVKSDQWRVSQFMRTQDQSGLEKVHMEAQARLPSNQINNLRTKAEGLSKPGIKYSIVDVQYTPSLADQEALQEKLRQNIYIRVKAELDLINKTYPEQNYRVHTIEFGQDGATPQPIFRSAKAENAAPMMMAAANNPSFTVSGKTVLNAWVVLATPVK